MKESSKNSNSTDTILPFIVIITGYLLNVNYVIIGMGALLLVFEAIKIFKDLKHNN
jgi:hypothetical protein